MVFKTKALKNAYQKQWMADKRNALYEGKKCAHCDAVDNLHFHHVDPKTKTMNVSAMWGRPKEEIEKEMAKCIVVCGKCHNKIHKKMGSYKGRKNRGVSGEKHYKAVLKNHQVLVIKDRLRKGHVQSKIAKDYGVSANCINHISTGRRWGHLND